MEEEMNPDLNGDDGEVEPDFPEAPEPEESYGTEEPIPEGTSVGRGNKGMLLVFLMMVVVGAVFGGWYWMNERDHKAWDDRLQSAVKAGSDEEFKSGMRAIMSDLLEQKKTSRADIMTQVAFELGAAGDAAAVPLLIRAVDWGESPGVEAAMALARIGGSEAKQGADAILRQMNLSEELRKAKYAWSLCMLGDDRGFPPLLEAVSKRIVSPKSIPDYDPDLIARVGTTDKLIELVKEKDPMLRMYAAMELGYRTDKDPVPALLELIKDKNNEVAQQAAISLGRTADERAGAALLQKMKESPELLDSILSAVTQSVGSPGLEAIYRSNKDPAIKYKIIGKIKQLRDPRSAGLLLTVLDEQFPGSDDKAKREADEIRNQALWILEDLGDKRIGAQMYAKTEWEEIPETQIPDPSIRYRENDMRRKIANGVASWFGTVLPDDAADFLEKIYDRNQPYSNTPECAQRVKVDIGPLLDSMGRTGDLRFCKIVEQFVTQAEGFYSQAAMMALGRLHCPGAIETFVKAMAMTKEERKEEKFSTTIEGRDWQMEDRLQERRNSIIAVRFIGDPKAAETLMEILLDPTDDQELRREAADSLAYVSDEKVMEAIVEKVSDTTIDVVVRSALIQGLWHKPSAAAVEAMMKLLEGDGESELVRSAAIVIGESGDTAMAGRLNKMLDHKDENRQRAAVMAILLGAGNLDRLDRVLEILAGQEARLVIRDWYESHPIFLTREMFDSGRVFRRLEVTRALADRTENTAEEILWPWKHLMQRLKNGWDASPGGLTALDVRFLLAEAVRGNGQYRELAAKVIGGLNERGFLLALQAEKGPQSVVAREMLRVMNVKSQ
jgi:HEAT repeat protein